MAASNLPGALPGPKRNVRIGPFDVTGSRLVLIAADVASEAERTRTTAASWRPHDVHGRGRVRRLDLGVLRREQILTASREYPDRRARARQKRAGDEVLPDRAVETAALSPKYASKEERRAAVELGPGGAHANGAGAVR
jgi:hypothetical protein